MKRTLAFLLFSLCLTLIFFKGMASWEFLFISDELLVLTENEGRELLSLYDPNNLGTLNATILFAGFFDKLYYALAHAFDLGAPFAQKGLYFLKLFLLIALPYAGFRKLSKMMLVPEKSALWLTLVSLWYSFNTYTLILWNANGFSFTLLLCYAFAPLALYYLYRAVLAKEASTRDRMRAALLLYVMSFALPLFLAFVLAALFSIGLVCAARYSGRAPFRSYVDFEADLSLKNLARNLCMLGLFYSPFLYAYFLILYGMFAIPTDAMYITGGEGYGNLQGSVLYPLLMWFSWGIYTYWEPRSTFTFYQYFSSFQSLLAPFLLYAIIAYGAFKKAFGSVFFLSFLGTLLAFLTLVKGAQNPFGSVYLSLLENLPIFRAFRSPESKFGFVIVLLVALLLLISFRRSKGRAFFFSAAALASVILIQSYPLFTGLAIKGENTDHSYDRIIHVPKDYFSLATFLNESADYGYVMTLPSVDFGLYHLDAKESFIGQDLLPKLIKFPFVYAAAGGSLPSSAYGSLTEFSEESLRQYPVRYFVWRSDIASDTGPVPIPPNSFRMVFENPTFKLYENPGAVQIIERESGKPLSFEKLSPTEYKIVLSDIQPGEKLFFRENFTADWGIFAADGAAVSRGMWPGFARQIGYLFKTEIFGASHQRSLETPGHEWILGQVPSDQETVLLLYFKPQSYLLLGLIVSTLAVAVYLSHGIFMRRGKSHRAI